MRRLLDPKDPGADRGRAVSPRSRAIVVTFDVATCAAFLPVSVAHSSLATLSARDELSDLAQGPSENRAYGTSSAARATTRPSATSATSRSSTTASRWPHSSATACSALLGVVKGEHKFLLYCQYCGYVADVSPQEQWDNIPVIGKLQIFTFVGMLESYGEILGDVPHYTCTTRLRATARRSSSTPTQAVRPRVADIITLADIAYLPLMRCRQLLTWFVTARQPAGVLLCAWT